MANKKDAQLVLELSRMLEKQSLNRKGANDDEEEADKNFLMDNETRSDVDKVKCENPDQCLTKIMKKVEDIIETWKSLIPDPLNCSMQSVQNSILVTSDDSTEIQQALFSTFRHVKEIQDCLVQPTVQSDQKVCNLGNTGLSFIDMDTFSHNGVSDRVVEVNSEVHYDLTDEEAEKGNDKPHDSENTEPVCMVRNAVESRTDGLFNVADETVYEDCEDELQQEITDEAIDDDTFDDVSCEDSNDTESEDDSSWVVSDSDSSGSEGRKRPKIKDLPKVNFNTTNTTMLGLWLSDTGPVHLNTMCHCKGSCLRNCVCKTADISCSRRCGCKPDKCKRMKMQEMEEENYTDEEYKEKLRAKKTVTGPSNDKLEPSPTKKYTSSSAVPVFSTPAPVTVPRPAKTKPEDTSTNETFSTPACCSPSHTTDNSLVSSTAKKSDKNKKSLFQESWTPRASSERALRARKTNKDTQV